MGRRGVVAMVVVGLGLAACRTASVEPPPPGQAVALAVAEPHVESPKDRVAEVPAPEEIPEVVAEPEPEPEPEPAPIPFEGLEKVAVADLVTELDAVADEIARSPAVRADYDALVAAHDLRDTEALYRDYVRVKLAFEATRDAGLWHLHWDITNEKPNSDQIWKQWGKAAVPSDDAPQPTAIAECDELSALFAFVARKLGVRHIGLFWPQWNHVVAVWTVQSADESPVRIVVPTSQIFLTDEDSLGTAGFDPWTQKTIYEYRRRDVKGSHRIDAELARFFVEQARRHGGRSQLELQRLRNERDLSMSAG